MDARAVYSPAEALRWHLERVVKYVLMISEVELGRCVLAILIWNQS